MAALPFPAAALGERTAYPGILRSSRDHALICLHCRESQELNRAVFRSPDRNLEIIELFALEHSGCRKYANQPRLAKAHRRYMREMRKNEP